MISMKKNYSFSEEKFRSTIKRSQTTSAIESTIEKQRGFKPTDRFDPMKKTFLLDLSKKIWNRRVVIDDLFAACVLMLTMINCALLCRTSD